MNESAEKLRLDKWLWHARFFKTRSIAAREVSAGHVRVNAERVTKPAAQIAPDDVLTFAQGRVIRVVRIVALGTRRGPAPEAQALYEDLTPPSSETAKKQDNDPPAPRYEGKGRPTKRDRRKLDLNKPQALD